MCSDSIQFQPIGAITQPLIEWVNRPTFQQADEIQGHGPRIAPGASERPAAQRPNAAVIGNLPKRRGRGASILIRPRHSGVALDSRRSGGFFSSNERLKLQV